MQFRFRRYRFGFEITFLLPDKSEVERDDCFFFSITIYFLTKNFEKVKRICDLLIEMGLDKDSTICVVLTERYQIKKIVMGTYFTRSLLPLSTPQLSTKFRNAFIYFLLSAQRGFSQQVEVDFRFARVLYTHLDVKKHIRDRTICRTRNVF